MPTRCELANAIRALSMDAVQRARSGHPGMPMGMADIAEVLWNNFLSHNPRNPHWLNRDRFVVSNGHGCMLLYSLLYLTGYDLSIEDIKQFRQLHSRTPGHPEYGITPGVETTTGPLGQGLGNAVGMAIAEKCLAATFNQPNFPIIDHHTYVFLGDGCLMEGISHEVCSLAGTLKLGKLIAFWDDNGISIDGEVSGWFTDNTAERFRAYGWEVIEQVDGHNPDAITQAIQQAHVQTNKPTLICCKTVIGFGAPNLAGTAKTHGSPLGEAEIAAAREQLNWPYPAFEIPNEIKNSWDGTLKGEVAESKWQTLWQTYQSTHPQLAQELNRRLHGEIPDNFAQNYLEFLQTTLQENKPLATRKASQKCIEQLHTSLPELLGGSADLSESNLTLCDSDKIFNGQSPDGNYIYYGVREFGMAAIMNGIALHGGFIPFGGTFLTFADYARNGIRMSALNQQRVIYVFTHDSIGLGEDGPTHQPIEHASMLRMTPNVSVWRPADFCETAVAWQHAIQHKNGPSALLLTRQNCSQLPHSTEQLTQITRGAYVLKDSHGTPELILIATGSEVAIALAAAHQLAEDNINVRVVSMPSTTTFDLQDANYKEHVLPQRVRARISIEAAATGYWFKYVGLDGKAVGIDRFGESAPAEDIYRALNLTPEHLVIVARELLQKTKTIC